VTEPPRLWDATPQHTGRLRLLLRRWRLGVVVAVALAALAVLIVPLVITGRSFEKTLTAKNPLEQLAKEAQPPSATVFDSGFRNGGDTGFAYGISADPPAAVLAVVAPAPWQPGPPTPEAPNMRLWKTGHLVLTVRADPCLRLERCKPGDTLVYTEVLDVGS
jgi:hypothetical protein